MHFNEDMNRSAFIFLFCSGGSCRGLRPFFTGAACTPRRAAGAIGNPLSALLSTHSYSHHTLNISTVIIIYIYYHDNYIIHHLFLIGDMI